jgi:hypothetical protein
MPSDLPILILDDSRACLEFVGKGQSVVPVLGRVDKAGAVRFDAKAVSGHREGEGEAMTSSSVPHRVLHVRHLLDLANGPDQ